MADSYLNIVSFLITTLFYFVVLKPSISIDILSDQGKYKEYLKNHHLCLAIYLLLVIVVQFIVNASVITNMCGGNITDNIGSAGLITIFPWLLIFGTIIIILVVYPGFKSAFSDVIGYYYVSFSANKILTTLLIDKDIEKQLDGANVNNQEKESMRNAADTIIKMCGNTSIIINQIVPSNFLEYWRILTPLMKQEYRDLTNQPLNPTTTTDLIEQMTPVEPSAPPLQLGGQSGGENLQKQFFDLVVTRENVGEAMWFIYTGILLTSFVQLAIVTKGCKNSPETMRKNQQILLEKQKADKAKASKSTDVVYKINS
jgi:hypothetical protein